MMDVEQYLRELAEQLLDKLAAPSEKQVNVRACISELSGATSALIEARLLEQRLGEAISLQFRRTLVELGLLQVEKATFTNFEAARPSQVEAHGNDKQPEVPADEFVSVQPLLESRHLLEGRGLVFISLERWNFFFAIRYAYLISSSSAVDHHRWVFSATDNHGQVYRNVHWSWHQLDTMRLGEIGFRPSLRNEVRTIELKLSREGAPTKNFDLRLG